MSCMIRDYKLPFKKYWYAFEASMAINVKSFEQHEIDPMLLNKTTSDFHETFIRHCLCSVALQSHHSIPKILNVKYFLAGNMNIGVFKRHEIS